MVEVKLMISLAARGKCRAVKITVNNDVVGIARSRSSARAFLLVERGRINDDGLYQKGLADLRDAFASDEGADIPKGSAGDLSFASFLSGDRRGISEYRRAMALHDANARKNALPRPPRYNR